MEGFENGERVSEHGRDEGFPDGQQVRDWVASGYSSVFLSLRWEAGPVARFQVETQRVDGQKGGRGRGRRLERRVEGEGGGSEGFNSMLFGDLGQFGHKVVVGDARGANRRGGIPSIVAGGKFLKGAAHNSRRK